MGIFGVSTTEAEARIVLLPVPWEVTTSYGKGASQGPCLILQASEQVDLFDLELGPVYKAGIHLRDIPQPIYQLSVENKSLAQKLLRRDLLADSISPMAIPFSKEDSSESPDGILERINKACEYMTTWVYQQSKELLTQGKLLGLIGGDHSTPLGALKALSEKHQGNFGVLHIDAHADLRCSYQGFHQSHASIMYNLMTSAFKPRNLIQVGLRDFCEEEFLFIKDHPQDIKAFFDLDMKQRMFRGSTWEQICQEIVSALPQNVYISFDIDGLDPALCPHTGTPVPGGLSLDQAYFLLRSLAQSHKRIIGFDLNEVSCGGLDDAEWDGNVGARLLYKLCGWFLKTNEN